MSVVIAVDPQPSLFVSDMKTLQCAISPGGILFWPLAVCFLGLLWAGLVAFLSGGGKLFAVKAPPSTLSAEADPGITERTVTMLGEATQEIEAAQKVRLCTVWGCRVQSVQALEAMATQHVSYQSDALDNIMHHQGDKCT